MNSARSGLAGEVIEAGAGNGLNFAHYPPAVTRVSPSEPEPHLREHAERAAREAPVPVTVVDAFAEKLPFADGAFDATVWPRLSGGCHLAREADRLIEAAGFTIERCDRFTFRIPPLDPPKTHVLGVARRP